MITNQKIVTKNGLGQYAKQIVAFLICLLIVSIYQHIRLYFEGLVDQVYNQSLWLHFINHIGLTSVVGLAFLAPYLYFEGKRPGNGKKLISLLLGILLLAEFLLTTYYLNTHRLLGANLDTASIFLEWGKMDLLLTAIGLVLLGYIFRLLSRRFNWPGRFLRKMFPFTIILFILVFGMLFTVKKPINQNKVQFLVTDLLVEIFDFNVYKGAAEYPFLTETVTDSNFVNLFELNDQNPDFVIIMVQGLGRDFVGPEAVFKDFAPFLNELSTKSLFWKNHLTNALDTRGAITALTAAIPHVETKNHPEKRINRNTLFGLLKERGYKTAFYYGGNNTLLGMDDYLFQDRVDLVIDQSKFDDKYKLSPSNETRTFLGYPDNQLFRKWEEVYMPSSKPKFELFVNLSTASGSFPNAEKYVSNVESITSKNQFSDKEKWSIERQKNFFGSMLYVDESIKNFLVKHQRTKEYKNTIYIITGTQNAPFLAQDNELKDYHVPFIICGPNIKAANSFSNITSHVDLSTSLLSLIERKTYPAFPKFSARLGQGLQTFIPDKKIPLFIEKDRMKQFVEGNLFFSSGRIHEIDDNLELTKKRDEDLRQRVSSSFKHFKASHKYALKENKIVPDSLTVFRKDKSSYSSEELVWISSVFNGKNFDKAYEKARSLAHNGNTERALLLSQYILEHIPNHVDALVLQGRIYAWNNKYNKALEILKNAMVNNPKYHDSYAAALDVCYWAKDKKGAAEIYEKMKENNVISIELDKKVQRCLKDPKVLNEVTSLKFELDES